MDSNLKASAWREPWFWAVFSPLMLVVVVCSVLVFFAVRGADDRVYDDYYQQGRLINNEFDAENMALALQVSGHITFELDDQQVNVELSGRAKPDQLFIQMSHPMDASLDHQLTLERRRPGYYVGALSQPIKGRWYAIVRAPETETQVAWRVSTEVNFNNSPGTDFSAHR